MSSPQLFKLPPGAVLDDDTPKISPYAKSGSYVTKLNPVEEQQFQSWVKANNIPFDPSPTSDYDMRGYFKANQGKLTGTKVSGFDGKLHFPDTYKTPYHKTFSNESEYATAGAPHWEGDVLKDKNGNIIADESVKPDTKGIKLPPGAVLDENSAPWKLLPSKAAENQTPLRDKIIEGLRPFVGPGAGAVVAGSGIGASLGLGTAPAAAVGLGTSALLDGLMQRAETRPPSSLLSKATGLTPGSVEDNIMSTLEMELGGKVSEGAIKGIFSKVKGLISGGGNPQIEENLQTAYEQRFGKSKAGQVLRTLFPSKLKNAPGQELTGPSDQAVNQLTKAYNITGGVGVAPDLEKVLLNPNSQINPLDNILSDPKQLSRALKLGSKGETDAVTPMREFVLRDALNDPSKGVEKFNNPDYKLSLNKLFTQTEQARISSYLDKLNSTDMMTHGKLNRYISYGSAGTILSTMLMHNHITPWGAGATAIAGFKLGSDALTKLITNPTTSRLMQNMVSGAPLGVSESYAANTIAKALQGYSMSQIDANGNEVPGTLDKDNKFIPSTQK